MIKTIEITNYNQSEFREAGAMPFRTYVVFVLFCFDFKCDSQCGRQGEYQMLTALHLVYYGYNIMAFK